MSSDLQSQNVSTGQYLNLTRIPGMTIVVARVREASAHRRLVTPGAVVAARWCRHTAPCSKKTNAMLESSRRQIISARPVEGPG